MAMIKEGPDPTDVDRPDLKGRSADLDRIRDALRVASRVVRPFMAGSGGVGSGGVGSGGGRSRGAGSGGTGPRTTGARALDVRRKSERNDPVTEADHALDRALREILPKPGEGWLSEETRDRLSRLAMHRVWVVDPLDGTREFVEGIPEWCVSVGLVEGGVPVAGGVLNPATGERFVGSIETGVNLGGVTLGGTTRGDRRVEVSRRTTLEGATILASRSELKRGEWDRFLHGGGVGDAGDGGDVEGVGGARDADHGAPFEVIPCGSVAYKLARVAAGLNDATWTLVPKNEWDVAAGAALVRAAGGVVLHADGTERTFNQADTKMPNLLAGPPRLIRSFINEYLSHEREKQA